MHVVMPMKRQTPLALRAILVMLWSAPQEASLKLQSE